MSEELELYDVTIIGGGPAGMYAAFYAGMREMKTKLIEAQEILGGRMLAYPEKVIWDVGGVPPTLCQQIIDDLAKQAQTFDPTIILGEHVVALQPQADGTYILTTASGQRHHTRTIILAIGYGIRKLAKLDIEGADRFEITNLHYTVQELEPFRGKRVLISGGGDSAVEWAIQLEEIAKSVTLVHRRNQFGGHERNVSRMLASSVDVRTPFAVRRLHSQDGSRIDQVIVNHLENEDEEIQIGVDAVIVNHGMRSDFGPVREWGLEMGEWEIFATAKLETNLPGVFVAGDSASFDSKVRLIAGAFTDAVMTVNGAKLFIDPQASKFGYVSSHNTRFNEKNKQLGHHA